MIVSKKTNQKSIAKESIGNFCFFLLCIVILIGSRPLERGYLQELEMPSKGSIYEAVSFIVLSSIIVSSCKKSVYRLLYEPIYIGVFATLAYCALSLFWSDVFLIALPRYLQFLIVTFSVSLFCMDRAVTETTRLFLFSLVTVIFVDIASVFVFTNAVHTSTDIVDVMGAWKGLHMHKNFAGAVAGLSAVILILNLLNKMNMKKIIALSASIVFLIGTRSKTGLYVAIMVLCLLLIFKFFIIVFGQRSAKISYLFLLFGVTFALPFTYSILSDALADGTALTGRVEIWNVLLPYINAYPLSGSGFASFWRVGENAPIMSLTRGWGMVAGQGHNGYLDAAVTLGIPGFLLVLISFALIPFYSFISSFKRRDKDYDVAFCLIAFALIHNVTETSLLAGNHPVFLSLLVGIGILSQFKTKDRIESVERRTSADQPHISGPG